MGFDREVPLIIFTVRTHGK